jgi:hypothetical protein
MRETVSGLNSKDVDEVLMAAAQAALGRISYVTKLTRTPCKDGRYKIRIDVYEKYRRPSRGHIALLKKYGVEAHIHRCSYTNLKNLPGLFTAAK